jgi:hypothetical protein
MSSALVAGGDNSVTRILKRKSYMGVLKISSYPRSRVRTIPVEKYIKAHLEMIGLGNGRPHPNRITLLNF